MEGPILSFVVKGKIKDNDIKLNLCHNELKYGLWQMSIKSILIKSSEILDISFALQTNFVNDIRFNINNEIEKYNPVLNIHHLKCTQNETICLTFDNIWYVVNSPSEVLQIFITDAFTNQIMSSNARVAVHILLKRIK